MHVQTGQSSVIHSLSYSLCPFVSRGKVSDQPFHSARSASVVASDGSTPARRQSIDLVDPCLGWGLDHLPWEHRYSCCYSFFKTIKLKDKSFIAIRCQLKTSVQNEIYRKLFLWGRRRWDYNQMKGMVAKRRIGKSSRNTTVVGALTVSLRLWVPLRRPRKQHRNSKKDKEK